MIKLLVDERCGEIYAIKNIIEQVQLYSRNPLIWKVIHANFKPNDTSDMINNIMTEPRKLIYMLNQNSLRKEFAKIEQEKLLYIFDNSYEITDGTFQTIISEKYGVFTISVYEDIVEINGLVEKKLNLNGFM